MDSRPCWGWFKHRLDEFRKIKFKVDEDLNIKTLLYNNHIELTQIIFEGIPAFYSMGNGNQLPPVVMKLIADGSNPNSSCSTDGIRKTAFYEFMNPPNQFETVNFTFYMTDSIRQKDGTFKNVLSSMINGTLMIENFRYLTNR